MKNISVSRRKFITTAIAGGIGGSFLPEIVLAQGPQKTQTTRYIAAYDTESLKCLAAVKKIVEVHKKFQMPATFFIVGKRLEENTEEYLRLLNNPLFEIASHTWSHKLLRNNPFCGPAVPDEEKRIEIFESKKIIERVFNRECVGFRPACAFDNALTGAPEVLEMIKQAGYKYVSSLAWGPDYSLPAPLNQPFNYQADGFSQLWELPAHGWHENLLKNNNKMGPKRITLWPPEMPEAIPNDFIKTPREEFEIDKVFLDKALKEKMKFVSLIWHPWSLDAFDPEMKMLELVFEYVQGKGFNTCTYGDLYHSLH